MKHSIRYCLKIQVHTKKHKDMYDTGKIKLKVMFMEGGRLEECNPEGALRLQLSL